MLKERIKMARLHSCICRFPNTQQGFSGKTPNQNYQTQGHQGSGAVSMERCHRLASQPEEEIKAKHRKSNFKKMVHNPNSSNSDKNEDSDCCK
jgi:hypothetical protein